MAEETNKPPPKPPAHRDVPVWARKYTAPPPEKAPTPAAPTPAAPTPAHRDVPVWARKYTAPAPEEAPAPVAPAPKDAPAPVIPKPKDAPAPVIPEPAAPTPARPEKAPPRRPGRIIERTPYPKWWKELQTTEIDISGSGTDTVVKANPTYVTYVATIVLTVSEEANVTMSFGVFGPSGAMDFGGADEPRGIVIAMGGSPASCGSGGFSISVSSKDKPAHVAGFCSYYQEPAKE